MCHTLIGTSIAAGLSAAVLFLTAIIPVYGRQLHGWTQSLFALIPDNLIGYDKVVCCLVMDGHQSSVPSHREGSSTTT
jgi:hypothetical protein